MMIIIVDPDKLEFFSLPSMIAQFSSTTFTGACCIKILALLNYDLEVSCPHVNPLLL